MQVIKSSGRYAAMKDAERSDYLIKPMMVGGKVVLVEGLNPNDNYLLAEEKEKVAIYRQAMEIQMGRRTFSGKLGEDVKRKRIPYREAKNVSETERFELWISNARYRRCYENSTREEENEHEMEEFV